MKSQAERTRQASRSQPLAPVPDGGGQSYSLSGDELSLSGPALRQLLEAVIEHGAPFRFRARGASMSPFIKDGDVITIVPLGGRAPRVGDVVAFARGPHLVVHRVVGQAAAGYMIQGDGLSESKETARLSQIRGRVQSVERNGRPVRLGLGRERVIIAWLTGSGAFTRIVIPLWIRLRGLVRRSG